jgi:hypothetical protein
VSIVLWHIPIIAELWACGGLLMAVGVAVVSAPTSQWAPLGNQLAEAFFAALLFVAGLSLVLFGVTLL